MADATGKDISPSGLGAPARMRRPPGFSRQATLSPEGGKSQPPVCWSIGRKARRATDSNGATSMASHQQLLYHLVFSTKGRRPLLRDDSFRDGVWRYMAGICSNLEGHAIQVGGHYEHAHLLVRIPAKIAVADFVRQLKSSTSKHINQVRNAALKFHWQDGYGAFTVSKSKSDLVVQYIDRQMEHHAKRTFKDEFLKMLADHEVEFDPNYIWA